MAEVRKKEVKDEYNTSKIVVKETKNKSKDKEVVKEKKDNNSSKSSKKNKQEEKKSLLTKFLIFCNGVKDEFHKVHWTSKKDMIKYSIACIFFIVFSALFFFGVGSLFIYIQSLFA